MKKKKILVVGSLVMMALVVAGAIGFFVKQSSNKKQPEAKETAYESLSESDKETADLYATLYEMSGEEVAEIQVEKKDWEQTGKELEKIFFTIDENVKYQMTEEGYLIEDLEEAEKLSVKTGRKAIELAKAKGKASDNKKWSDVVKDSEILSSEEQLGLSKKQIKKLKKLSLNKEERLEVALLLINESYTFEEVIKGLDEGKTVEELKKQTEK